MKVISFILSLLVAVPAIPCTRVLWDAGKSEDVIVGRSMDWAEDPGTNMWLLPRGISRDGLTATNPLKWVSKYGSVVLTAYDKGAADGMNEKGLTVNLLYLSETDFGKRDDKLPGVSVSLWPQYFLDNFETVAEAVNSMKDKPFQVMDSSVETAAGVKRGTVHLSVSDKTGDSVVIEYIRGKPKIYHSRNFKVMTNSPPFDKQLAALKQYQGFGGKKKLPGTTEAADRFVRAAYYEQNLPKPADYREAIAGVLSVLRNTSQPFGSPDPARPYISTTRWRTVADLTRQVYFYENTLSPYIVWVNLQNLNFQSTESIKKIELVKNYELSGDITGKFRATKPFEFLRPDAYPNLKAKN